MLPIIISALVFLFSIVLAWLVGPALGMVETPLLILRILLVAIGAIIAAVILFFHFRQKRREAAAMSATGGEDLDTLLRAAEKRLATAQRGGPKSLDRLPLVYILGEGNSAKTTTVLKSGLDPELIAGQIYRDQDVVATPVANVWYTRSCILVEAGDAVRKSPALWSKLIRRTRPRVMRSALGKEAPIRAAVVCISCEQFLGASASEGAAGDARAGNQMLRELARQLGMDVPVYVVLTKLDRVPNFAEFVRNLSSEEATEPLGMALAPSSGSAGLYAEKAMQAVTTSLDQVIFSLSEFRTELLTREAEAKNLDPVYEFPRELRKVRNNLANCLVELARPSHLNANPWLRGFYFTGVRAQIVQQAVAMAAPAARAQQLDAGATRMFSVEQAQAATATAAPQVMTQKVAQWCFLPRLLSTVILEDKALAATSKSGRTHVFRRVAFATISLLLLVCLAWLTVSWMNNGALERRVVAAAKALPATATPPGTLAAAQDLNALDQLRGAIVQLEGYEQNGAPWSYRFGLYHGDALLVPARGIYFDHFRRLLLTNTQANLVSAMNAVPATPQPGADYLATYNPLKAYLITTSHADKSTADFLSPVLLQYWENGRTPESDEQVQLARRQFDFYAAELARGNPYSVAPDTGAVTHAQTYLANFGGFERIYQQMITAASKAAHAVDFNRDYPGSAATVVDGHIVPGAFTHDGYAFMQDAIQHPDRYFSGEAWVLGNQAPPSLDRTTLAQQLTARYVQDFSGEWRAFLHAAQVVHYRSFGDAASKLQMLSNPNSPLLALVYTVSHNTNVANGNIAKEFQPTQAVVAPQSADKLVGTGNQGYITGLLGLQGALQQMSQDPAAATNPAAAAPVITAATQASTAASQTAQAFNLDPQGHVDQVTLTLLQEPITNVNELLRGRGAQSANAGGAGLCSAFGAVMGKFPFASTSTVDASTAELDALLKPGSGALWQFYDTTLKPLVVQQGTTYVAAPGAPTKVSSEFLRFFNQAAGLSALLYPSTPGGGLTFTARILPSPGISRVTLQIDSQNLEGSSVSRPFTWSPQTSQQAQLNITYATGTLPIQFTGPWALLHLLSKGRPGGGPGRLDFPVEVSDQPIVISGTPLIVHLELSGSNLNLLSPGGWSGMHCVANVAH
ncbi:MAG: ImcF-related family protein [Acidobacteriaceae bacterium]